MLIINNLNVNILLTPSFSELIRTCTLYVLFLLSWLSIQYMNVILVPGEESIKTK